MFGIKHIADMQVQHYVDEGGRITTQLTIAFGALKLSVYLDERACRALVGMLATGRGTTHGLAAIDSPAFPTGPLVKDGQVVLDGDTLAARKVTEYK